MFFAALGSYLSFYSFVIVGPCLLFLIENKNDSFKKVTLIIIFIIYIYIYIFFFFFFFFFFFLND